MRVVRSLVLAAAAFVLVIGAAPAGAQDGDVIGGVEISFDVGDVDAETGDFKVDAVEVSGDLEEGQEFTVVIFDADGAEVWSGSAEYTAPLTAIPADGLLVGDVASVAVEQGLTIVGGVQIEPPIVEWSAGGGAGGGDLALSMVLAVLLVAMVFRTPLPSASTQRWTK